MSKELPYFQFEPAEYLSGDIQLCSYEAQGVFVNLKAIYWQRDCVISLDQAKRRLKCDSAFEELINEKVIKIKAGDIVIDFLDEQYDLISKRKELLSKAGRKGARIKKDKATLKPPLSPVERTLKHLDKIREDKRKGDKIKEENIITTKGSFKMSDVVNPFKQMDGFDSLWQLWLDYRKENKIRTYKPIGLQGAYKKLWEISAGDLATATKIIHESISNGWTGFFELKTNGTKQNDSWTDWVNKPS